MTDPYRAMCAELAEEVEHLWSVVRDDNNEPHSLARRARALLDQSVAEEPTDEELLRLAREWNSGFESIELHFAADYARAVLSKWGNSQGILDSSPQPVAVIERLPKPDDCDEQGRCWWHGEGADMIGWTLDAEGASYYRAKFWLPANALPTPEATND